MDGTIFRDLLDAVRFEAQQPNSSNDADADDNSNNGQQQHWSDAADKIETLMKMRTDLWNGADFPYGSEFAWDTTGQVKG